MMPFHDTGLQNNVTLLSARCLLGGLWLWIFMALTTTAPAGAETLRMPVQFQRLAFHSASDSLQGRRFLFSAAIKDTPAVSKASDSSLPVKEPVLPFNLAVSALQAATAGAIAAYMLPGASQRAPPDGNGQMSTALS